MSTYLVPSRVAQIGSFAYPTAAIKAYRQVAVDGLTDVVEYTPSTGERALVSAGPLNIDAVGAIGINSSTGTISVGNDAVAQAVNIGTGAAARTITIGNGTGATSVVIETGTGPVEIGTNATQHDTTVGSTTGASSMVVQAGSAAPAELEITTDVVPGPLDIDGVGAVSINDSAGTIEIGDDVVAQAINIGTGAAARTITIGNTDTTTGVELISGATGVNTVNGINNTGAFASTSTYTTLIATLQALTGVDLVMNKSITYVGNPGGVGTIFTLPTSASILAALTAIGIAAPAQGFRLPPIHIHNTDVANTVVVTAPGDMTLYGNGIVGSAVTTAGATVELVLNAGGTFDIFMIHG